MPGPKNGERPYLAVPKPAFLDPVLGLFSVLACCPGQSFVWSLAILLTHQPNQTISPLYTPGLTNNR